MDIKRVGLVVLVVFVASVIGYLVLRKMDDKQNEQGIYGGFLHYATIACGALIPLSFLALFLLIQKNADNEGDKLFFELKKRCEFISLNPHEGKSIVDGGVVTFDCDGSQIGVSVSGEVFKNQVLEIGGMK